MDKYKNDPSYESEQKNRNPLKQESGFRISRAIPTAIYLLMLMVCTGCNLTGSDTSEPAAVFESEFRESAAGWDAFFTDYNVNQKELMNLRAEYRTLPEPLDITDMGHFISAVNRSDDIKMMFRKQVEDLKPNTEYNVQFEIRFATSVPSGCVGIGGPPGEAVRVIADATQVKPEAFVQDDYYRLNIQQSGDSKQWYQNAMIGNIANSRECEDGYQYEIKEVNSGSEHATVTTDDSGSAWLMFGTRSGFEGQTDLFYTYFRAVFRQN